MCVKETKINRIKRNRNVKNTIKFSDTLHCFAQNLIGLFTIVDAAIECVLRKQML